MLNRENNFKICFSWLTLYCNPSSVVFDDIFTNVKSEASLTSKYILPGGLTTKIFPQEFVVSRMTVADGSFFDTKVEIDKSNELFID